MQNDFIELFQTPPTLDTKICKIAAFGVRIFLEYTPYLVAATTWYLSNIFYGFTTLLLSFLLMGIIRSKMRNSSIPASQREFQYNDKGIADWFVGVWWCQKGSTFEPLTK